MLAVNLVSSEVRHSMYAAEQSCSSDEAQTVVKKRSKIHCAEACSEQRGCRDYKFDKTTKDCSLYKHKPLFHEDQQGCSGYKASKSIIVVLDCNRRQPSCRWQTRATPLKPGHGSLKGIEGDTIRYIVYHFLSMFNSNYGSISQRFWDIWRQREYNDLEIRVRGHSRSSKRHNSIACIWFPITFL